MSAKSSLWLRWAGALSELPEQHAEALGGWLPRLLQLVGPMRGQGVAGRGEPDGVSGLTRRGSYERLLMSEWAIAEVAPEEFLRRAAMREHLFVRRAERAPVQTRCCQVWLDAGPDQLGAPRLAHLALLLLLAERAEAAGALFRWGVIQDGTAVDGFDPIALQLLLKQRTREVVSAEHLAACDTGGVGLDEVWWIGGPRLSDLGCPPANTVLVTESLAPDVRALDVVLQRRTIRLALPVRASVAALLRDPLRRASVRTHRGPVRTRSSVNGRMIFTVMGDEVRVWTRPKRTHSRAKVKCRVSLDGAGLVGVAWTRKRLAVLVREGNELVLKGMDAQRWPGPMRLPCPPDLVLPAPDAPIPRLVPLPRGATNSGPLREGFFFVDGARQLWAAVFSANSVQRIERGVVALKGYRNMVFVLHDSGAGVVCARYAQQLNSGASDNPVADMVRGAERALVGASPAECHFGAFHLEERWPQPGVLYRGSAGWHWSRAYYKATPTLELSLGSPELIGVGVSLDDATAQVFTLSGDGSEILLGLARRWFFDPPVDGAVMVDGESQMLLATRGGQVLVLHHEHDAPLVTIDVAGHV